MQYDCPFDESIDRSPVLESAPSAWDISVMLRDGISGDTDGSTGVNYNGCQNPNDVVCRIADPFMAMEANNIIKRVGKSDNNE